MIMDELYGQFEEHAKMGSEVWKAGDLIEDTKKVVVGPSRHADCKRFNENSYEAVNAFWNSVYFDNYEAAEKVCRQWRCEYTDWLYGLR